MKSIEKIEQKYFNPAEGVNLDSLDDWAKEQFALEINGNMTIKSIIADEPNDSINSDENKNFFQQQWDKTEKEWKEVLKESFVRQVKTLQIQSNEMNSMTMYPYLSVLDPQYYVDAIIEEIRMCANMSEYYSPHMTLLYADLGKKIMYKYLVKTHIRDGTAQDFQELYDKYMKYYKSAELITKYNPREYWQKLMKENSHFYNNDSGEKMWPFHVQVGVGNFLYDLILREIRIDSNILRNKSTQKKEVPAFCLAYKCIGDLKYKQEIRTNPTLFKLYRKACLNNLVFDMNMLPMLCPPTPWISLRVGGYLLTNTDLVRMPDMNTKWTFEKYDNQSLYPSFDSLNSLSLCPWIINKRVIQLIYFLLFCRN
jgi:DNA-directed RNA polymerase